MAAFAGLTSADLCVGLTLLLLAVLMWFGRRIVGVLLRFLPVVMAPLCTALAYLLYRLGESMSWDSPGSPAIIVVVILLACAIFLALAGWIALIAQIRGLRKPRTESPQEKRQANDLRVGTAIVIVVLLLFSAYRSYRAHRPSHDADVQQLVYSADGQRLYSLDRAGVLKQWDMRYGFQSGKWELPSEGEVRRMLVDRDNRILLLLSGTQLRAWGLADAGKPKALASTSDVLAIEAVAADAFVLLRKDAIELHSFHDIVTPQARMGLASAALSAAVAGEGRVIVGTEDRELESYQVGGGSSAIQAAQSGLKALPPLDLMPRVMRADRSGRYIVVSDPGAAMVVVDLQAMKLAAISAAYVSQQFEISGVGQLLLPEVSSLSGYDLESGRTEPLFNHGGTIGALAVDTVEDGFAVGNDEQIFVRKDSRHYAGSETWLNGRVELADLVSFGRSPEAASKR